MVCVWDEGMDRLIGFTVGSITFHNLSSNLFFVLSLKYETVATRLRQEKKDENKYFMISSFSFTWFHFDSRIHDFWSHFLPWKVSNEEPRHWLTIHLFHFVCFGSERREQQRPSELFHPRIWWMFILDQVGHTIRWIGFCHHPPGTGFCLSVRTSALCTFLSWSCSTIFLIT